MRMRFTTVALLGALAMPVGVAVAQEGRNAGTQQQNQQDRQPTVQGDQRPNANQGDRGTQAGQVDRQTQRFLLDQLRMANQGEVEIAKFAQDKARNDRVKQFAQKMQEDHQQFLQQLDQATNRGGDAGNVQGMGAQQQGRSDTGREDQNNPMSDARHADRGQGGTSAGSPGVASPAAQGRPHTNQATGATTTAQAAGGMTGAAGEAQWDANHPYATLRQVNQELHRRHLGSMRDMLNEKDGAKFDQAYIGSQIHMHVMMLDKLAVYQNHVSDDVRDVLAQGERTTKQHLEQARQIMRQLEQDQRSASAD